MLQPANVHFDSQELIYSCILFNAHVVITHISKTIPTLIDMIETLRKKQGIAGDKEWGH
jgi:hypothetical protein